MYMRRVQDQIAPMHQADGRVDSTPCVLVVEDDADSQILMRTILRAHYDVRIASSDEEMRSELEASPVALVLMDVSLRGSENDGLMLARTLRADPRWTRMPIVALTAHASLEDRAQALAAGCDAFLTKPVSAAELVATIAPLIARRR